jgi:hypothetical protein
LKSAIQRARFLQLLLELLRRRLELFHPIREFPLLTGQRLGLLGGLVAHLLVVPLARSVLGSLLELPLRRCRCRAASDRRVSGVADGIALLTQRGQPDYEFPAHSGERPG